MEYTQEQIDKMIEEAVSKAKTGLFTEDELNKRVTAEVDRRVESGIQKGIETQRKKWESEYEQKAKLTAEELAQKELQERLAELESRERDINKQSNLLRAKSMLSEAEVPQSAYEKMLETMVSDDSERTEETVGKFVDVFKSLRSELETKLKSEHSRVPAPKTGESGDVITKEVFDKMGYGDKVKLKTENPELYKSFIN